MLKMGPLDPLTHQTPTKIAWEEHLIDVRFYPDLRHL